MHRILYLIPSLGYGRVSRQMSLLATTLPRSEFEVCVAVLGGSGPLARPFQAAGVRLEILGWRRLLDLNPFLRLARLLRSYQPALVHVWGLACARSLWLTNLRAAFPWLASEVSSLEQQSGRLSRLDRRLLRQAAAVIASSAGEQGNLVRQGIAVEQVVRIPPGVAPAAAPASATTSLRKMLGLDDGARILICAGALEPREGHLDGIWCLDILKYLYPNLHLVLFGEGSDRQRLQSFVRSIGAAANVHFVGWQTEEASLLAQAEVVWIPSRKASGVDAALGAMAAGRPVVATRVPAANELVVEGETGFLVTPQDKIAMARQTRQLLDDPQRRQRMGEQARQRAESQFSAALLVERAARLYQETYERFARTCPAG
jgi:glycosyltransferase involved in cell wall biosynthesis